MTSIARLTVTLDDVEPKVMRDLEVPYDLRLDRLHQTLQAALGWSDSHLWQIAADGDTTWGIPDPDWPEGPLDGRKTTLAAAIEDNSAMTLRYLYDFGDSWEHVINITSIVEGDPQLEYPVLTNGAGRCPPEDVGGTWGYADFLEAIADPNHEDHYDMIQWAPKGFKPDDAQLDDLKAAVAQLAKSWKPKRRK
jgi:hypothetical protein